MQELYLVERQPLGITYQYVARGYNMSLEINSLEFEQYSEKLAEIHKLEIQSQDLRVMRNAILGNADAIATLQSIEDQISVLRNDMAILISGVE